MKKHQKIIPKDEFATNIALWIENLSVVRGHRLIIDRLNHRQKSGELCLLTGANGAGKSTLLRTIAGRIPKDSGQIHCTLPRVYIGHSDGLAGAISGRKNLKSWAAINNIAVNNSVLDQALNGFDTLEFADMPVNLLSRGQRRRLALARLYFSAPQSLWLLDEPNTGIDDDGNARLESTIVDHLAGGGSVMLATHILMVKSKVAINLVLGS